MAKQLFINDIIGSGTRTDPYRPVIASLGNPNRVSVLRVGFPVARPSALTLVAAVNLTPFHADARVRPLPQAGYGDAWFAVDILGRASLTTDLFARGFDATLLADLAATYGQIVRGLGTQIEPAFTELNFDVFEGVSLAQAGVAEPEFLNLHQVEVDGQKVWAAD